MLTARSRYYVSTTRWIRPSPSSWSATPAGCPCSRTLWRPTADASWASTFEAMIEAGLAGLEIDHRDNPEEGRDFLRRLAERARADRHRLQRLPRHRQA